MEGLGTCTCTCDSSPTPSPPLPSNSTLTLTLSLHPHSPKFPFYSSTTASVSRYWETATTVSLDCMTAPTTTMQPAVLRWVWGWLMCFGECKSTVEKAVQTNTLPSPLSLPSLPFFSTLSLLFSPHFFPISLTLSFLPHPQRHECPNQSRFGYEGGYPYRLSSMWTDWFIQVAV